MKFSPIISCILTLCLLATAAVSATMRMDTGTGQFVTICAGGQSVTVELDHKGAPLAAQPHCPDCTLMVVLTPEQNETTAHAVAANLGVTRVVLSQIGFEAILHSARGPPVTV